MDDLLMAPAEPKAKKKRAKKKKPAMGALPQKEHGVHVHVNVVNSTGEHHKKAPNAADDDLLRMRGW